MNISKICIKNSEEIDKDEAASNAGEKYIYAMFLFQNVLSKWYVDIYYEQWNIIIFGGNV